MSWDDRDFTDLGLVKGTLTMNMMGQTREMPYEANLWRDAAGEVGAVAADTPGGTRWLFVSLTEAGGVYTQQAPRDGDVDIDGKRLVTTTGGSRDEVLSAHLAAVGDTARADADGLRAALEVAPQTAVDLAAEMMKRLSQGLSSL